MSGKMWDSSDEMKRLMVAIAERVKGTIERHWKRFGPPQKSPRMVECEETFLLVSRRFKSGDFRHSSMELGMIAEFAQWLATVHAVTHGHPPKQVTIIESEMIKQNRAMG